MSAHNLANSLMDPSTRLRFMEWQHELRQHARCLPLLLPMLTHQSRVFLPIISYPNHLWPLAQAGNGSLLSCFAFLEAAADQKGALHRFIIVVLELDPLRERATSH